MGGKKKRLLEKTRQVQQDVVDLLEMPKDVMLDLPKITMIGDLQLFLENHRGIIEYQRERIRVKISNGELEIKGQDLVLRNLKTDEMAVEGMITSITFDS
ncbi:MAG TPA: sporulation protein YqfC [Clostridia bacterium]|nr:sporulation protein YqfC [Clostridia bacterium]